MRIFRTALRLVARRPGSLAVYFGMMGVLGVLLVEGFTSQAPEAPIDEAKPTVVVVDHDDSELSRALAAEVAKWGEPRELGDSQRELRDAAAVSGIAYIALIPEGYQADFEAAARAGGQPPRFETVDTLDTAQEVLIDQRAEAFLRLTWTALAAQPEAGLDLALTQAERASAAQAEQAVVERQATGVDTTRFGYFAGFAAYPLTVGILALAGLMFRAFQVGDVRRRNLASPVSPRLVSWRLGLAGVVVCLLAWSWMSILSLAPSSGGLAVAAGAPLRFALVLVALLVFTAAPLALAFLASQLGMSEAGMGGFANLVGLAFAFLGGLFTAGLEPGEVMTRIGQFTPAYWHAQAVEAAIGLTEPTWAGLGAYLGPLGVVLLFAAVFAAVGLVVGPIRSQLADSAGQALPDPA
ncbi:MAG: ABC transporter permease [Bifidobacteriaceae bacterium]|jgi:ABC-2 type transport system permease protein|nr:ABC transporter permease [Bifidobacteriaceae bacterium]